MDVNILAILSEFADLLPYTFEDTCDQNTNIEIKIKIRDGKIVSYLFEWHPAE